MYRHCLAGVVVAVSLLSVGCTKYYQVTDPTTGRQYYTTEIKTRDGATVLVDKKTGKKVTIQNSEVMDITQSQYKQAIKGE